MDSKEFEARMKVTSPDGLIAPTQPLVQLAVKWQRHMGSSVSEDEVSYMVADQLLGLFNTMAHNKNGTNPYPQGFDMTHKDGKSPIDEALFARVGYLEADRPAAVKALHEELTRLATQGVTVANGGTVQSKEGRILLMPGRTDWPPPLFPQESGFQRAKPMRFSFSPKNK